MSPDQRKIDDAHDTSDLLDAEKLRNSMAHSRFGPLAQPALPCENLRMRGMIGIFPSLEVQSRIKRAVKIDPISGCWVWQRTTIKSGYGQIGSKLFGRASHNCNQVRHISAHRASWLGFKGDIPGRLWVLHRCDNPPCVNPEHLFLGTALDNVRDAIAKGRVNSPEIRARISASKTKTHCIRGHQYPETPPGVRHRCPTCIRITSRRRKRAPQSKKRAAFSR